MTKIKPEQKNKTVSFGHCTVERFWLEIPASASIPSTGNNQGTLGNLLSSVTKDSVVCVFSEELSGKELCKSLASARDNDNRIYILTNEFHGEMKNLSGCLIRYGGGRRLGSFMLINPNSSHPMGCFFTGKFSDGSLLSSTNLMLDLDASQVSVLFRHFCYQFWNKAEKEYLQGKEQNTDSAPIDVYPPKDDGCDFEYLKSVWNREEEYAYITTTLFKEGPYLKYSNFSNSIIISLFSGMDNDLIRALEGKNNKLYAFEDTSFINSVKTNEGTWLIPIIGVVQEEELYALLLNESQKKTFDKHINTLSHGKVSYQYFEKESREKLSDRTVCRLGDDFSKKFRITAETGCNLEIPMPGELLPKEQLDSYEPDFPDDGRSVSILYRWANRPFTLPAGGVKHPLYKNWEDTQKSILLFISHIEGVILENEKKGKAISNRIKSLILGKQQKITEYQDKLKEFKNTNFSSMERTKAQKVIDQINSIRELVEKDTGEIYEENRIALLEDEIDKLKSNIQDLEKNLAGKEEDLDKIEKEIKNPSEKKKKQQEDLVVNRNRLSNDIEKQKKTIEKNVSEIRSLEAEIKKPLKGKKAEEKKGSVLDELRGSGKKTSPGILPQKLSVPVLDRLPDTGELYQLNGQNYLAIMYWEDYDNGKKEAARLHAKLCAKGE